MAQGSEGVAGAAVAFLALAHERSRRYVANSRVPACWCRAARRRQAARLNVDVKQVAIPACGHALQLGWPADSNQAALHFWRGVVRTMSVRQPNPRDAAEFGE